MGVARPPVAVARRRSASSPISSPRVILARHPGGMPALAVERACKLSEDRRRRIGVAAEIHGLQAPVAERVRRRERPQRRLEAIARVPGPADRATRRERARSDLVDLRTQQMIVPVARKRGVPRSLAPACRRSASARGPGA